MTNPNQLPLKEIQQKIDESSSILIVLPALHSIDSISAGLSFYLSLQKYVDQSEKSKSITLASATDPTVAYQRLYGVGNITRNVGSKNLVISLKTAHDNIEKISVDEGASDFNIIVETKSGVPRLEQKDIEYSYRGLHADLIIAIGLSNAESAGNLYNQNPSLFADRDSIIISGDMRGQAFGSINVVEQQASGTSEIVSKLIRFLKFPVDGDLCTNLIAGIEAATNNFAAKTNADTFAAIAWCMKEGGRRNHLTMPLQQQPGFGNSPFGAQVGGYNQQPYTNPPAYVPPQAPSYNAPFTPQPFNPAPQTPPVTASQMPAHSETNKSQENADDSRTSQAPADWLEPKIYRGGQS